VNSLSGTKAYFVKSPHQFQRRLLVSPGLDQNVEHFAFGVDVTPQIDHAAIDLQVDLIQMPGRMGLRPALRRSAATAGPKWFTQRWIV
jgi:hypothetical protein